MVHQMKKLKISISLISFIILIFSLSSNVFGVEYSKEAWASEKAFDSFNTFVETIQSEKPKDISDIELCPGGIPFGVKITSCGLIVTGFSSTEGNDASAAYAAGVRIGDIIIKLNGKQINSISDFTPISSGDKITLTVLRNNKELNFSFYPKYSRDEGKYKTGLYVKDSTSGIGTVTYIDPKTGVFGGLGHGICNSTDGSLVSFAKGIVLDANINGVIKGKIGTAGELKGTLGNKKIGALYKNSNCGVFGVLSQGTYSSPEKPMKVAKKEEVKEGDAALWCTLSDAGPKKYTVQISDINVNSTNIKNFKVKITDPELLKQTGGIVQGMSGSPIIQNGKIIGAVTHVLINDPTTGYGIFIENMIDNMSDILK